MKKYTASMLAMLLIASFFALNLSESTVQAATQATYYVSPTGSDSNNGTSTATPFQTIGKAQSIVRTINGNMTGDIIVYLRGGTYTVGNTISFGSTDSGTNGFNVKYLAYPGEKPIISGGQALSGTWTLYDSSKNIYALTGVTSDFRQLYVNEASFIPSEDLRELRDLCRLGKKRVGI